MLLQYLPLVLLPLIPQSSSKGLAVKPRGADRLRVSLQALSTTVGDGRVLIRLFGWFYSFFWGISSRKLKVKQILLNRAHSDLAVDPFDSEKVPGQAVFPREDGWETQEMAFGRELGSCPSSFSFGLLSHGACLFVSTFSTLDVFKIVALTAMVCRLSWNEERDPSLCAIHH